MRIIDINVNEQSKALYRKYGGGNVWRELGEKGKEQVLTEAQILELSELIIKIENHYGFPCDIEWAMENGKLYIVQSRPITTLQQTTNVGGVGKRKRVVEELVHLDIPLAFVELHCEQESTRDLPWASELFPYTPFVFYKRENGVVYAYYDVAGMEWQKKQAGNYGNMAHAVKQIKEKYNRIKPIIEEECALEKNKLLDFFNNVRALWPWIAYMWWAIEYKERHGENFDELLRIRKYTEHLTPGMLAVTRHSIREMYPNYEKYIGVLRLDEVSKGDLPDEEELQTRLEGYSYTDGNLYRSWEELASVYSLEIPENPTDERKDVLSGQTAYRGKVQGRIKIVRARGDIDKVKEGDIILSSTTTPDYLPAMKRSAAIISEHGGSICHAAITSRELKIPCIVGVKGATQVLHDGDMVEVDADNGVVRVLEKV